MQFLRAYPMKDLHTREKREREREREIRERERERKQTTKSIDSLFCPQRIKRWDGSERIGVNLDLLER